MVTTIGIVSGKGGVGKTTLALNLGVAAHTFGENVHILDGDTKNPTVGIYLGIYKFPLTFNDFLRGKKDFNQVLYDYNGIKILPASLSLYDTNVSFGKLGGVLDGVEGCVIVDFPPGLTRDTLNLMAICDKFIVVTNPTFASLASTMRFINVIGKLNKGIIGIVVNKTGKKYEISTKNIESVFVQNILASIPEDEHIRKSAMLKKTVIESNPYARSSIAIMELAAKLFGKEYKKPRLRRMRGLLKKFGIA